MKNLIPFNNLAKKKFMFQQQIEEDPDQDTRKSHLKSKDNVFFAEFSGNSRQESQQNPFSTTSFKQVHHFFAKQFAITILNYHHL